MRISDWSSDVCSSDLLAFAVPLSLVIIPIGVLADRVNRIRLVSILMLVWSSLTADRKSVAEGKSVLVRVDFGGRRIIKKNNSSNYLFYFCYIYTYIYLFV